MPDIWISLLTIFILGLFIGTNLGVLLICLMRMASPDAEPESLHNPVPLEERKR